MINICSDAISNTLLSRVCRGKNGPPKERALTSIRVFSSGRQLASDDGFGCGGSTQCAVSELLLLRAPIFFCELG
jgi:hypothetical protein